MLIRPNVQLQSLLHLIARDGIDFARKHGCLVDTKHRIRVFFKESNLNALDA